MLKHASKSVFKGVVVASRQLIGQHSIGRPILQFNSPSIFSYRTITTGPQSPSSLLPLDQLRIAMMLPIAKELPSLDNPQLESEIFGKGYAPGYPKANMYRRSFHPQRLEFLGDRIYNKIAAEIVFLIVPNLETSVIGSNLKIINEVNYFVALSSNETCSNIAFEYREFDSFKHQDSKEKADRFEAYIAGLYFSKGEDSVRDFLAPIFKMKIDDIRNRGFYSLEPLSNQPINSTQSIRKATSAIETNNTDVKKDPNLTSTEISNEVCNDISLDVSNKISNAVSLAVETTDHIQASQSSLVLPLLFFSYHNAKTRLFEKINKRLTEKERRSFWFFSSTFKESIASLKLPNLEEARGIGIDEKAAWLDFVREAQRIGIIKYDAVGAKMEAQLAKRKGRQPHASTIPEGTIERVEELPTNLIKSMDASHIRLEMLPPESKPLLAEIISTEVSLPLLNFSYPIFDFSFAQSQTSSRSNDSIFEILLSSPTPNNQQVATSTPTFHDGHAIESAIAASDSVAARPQVSPISFNTKNAAKDLSQVDVKALPLDRESSSEEVSVLRMISNRPTSSKVSPDMDLLRKHLPLHFDYFEVACLDFVNRMKAVGIGTCYRVSAGETAGLFNFIIDSNGLYPTARASGRGANAAIKRLVGRAVVQGIFVLSNTSIHVEKLISRLEKACGRSILIDELESKYLPLHFETFTSACKTFVSRLRDVGLESCFRVAAGNNSYATQYYHSLIFKSRHSAGCSFTGPENSPKVIADVVKWAIRQKLFVIKGSTIGLSAIHPTELPKTSSSPNNDAKPTNTPVSGSLLPPIIEPSKFSHYESTLANFMINSPSLPLSNSPARPKSITPAFIAIPSTPSLEQAIPTPTESTPLIVSREELPNDEFILQALTASSEYTSDFTDRSDTTLNALDIEDYQNRLKQQEIWGLSTVEVGDGKEKEEKETEEDYLLRVSPSSRLRIRLKEMALRKKAETLKSQEAVSEVSKS